MNNTAPTKYHISPKTNKLEPCNANVRRCRYGGDEAHVFSNNPQAAAAELSTLITRTLTKKPEGIQVEPAPFKVRPDLGNPMSDQRYFETTLITNPGYDYDAFECDDEDCDGYRCHHRKYIGFRVNEFTEDKVRGFVANYYGVNEYDIPDELVQHLIDEEDFANRLNPRYDIVDGYNGEDIKTRGNTKLIKIMNDLYYKYEGASDTKGILDYVRSKGVETTGLNPVEALKKQLVAENQNTGGRVDPRIENAQWVDTATIPLRNIVPGNKEHFDRIKTDTTEIADSDSFFAGVVVRVSDTKYELVDGYHRTKKLKQGKEKKEAKYLVLTSYNGIDRIV